MAVSYGRGPCRELLPDLALAGKVGGTNGHGIQLHEDALLPVAPLPLRFVLLPPLFVRGEGVEVGERCACCCLVYATYIIFEVNVAISRICRFVGAIGMFRWEPPYGFAFCEIGAPH